MQHVGPAQLALCPRLSFPYRRPRNNPRRCL